MKHQFIHAKQQKQEPPTHSHVIGHGIGGMDHGLRLMAFLSVLQHTIAHNSEWMSDYREAKLVPASNKVIIGTILVLLAGVVLWHILPTNLTGVGLVIIVAATVHLALLVVVGLSITLFIRHQRARVRQTVISSIPWRGTEQVLDVGCGTGMLLNGCARQLTTGKAVGVDLWLESVAGTPSVLMANARAEGVVDKVEYQEMDARDLTFENSRFNVVVSSLALHHIGAEREDREQAVSQMIRVLAPGGYLSLVDVKPMIDIAESVIVESGLQIVHQEQTRFFRFLTARKG